MRRLFDIFSSLIKDTNTVFRGQFAPEDAQRGTETMWFFPGAQWPGKCYCIYGQNGWHTNEHAGASTGAPML